MSHLRIVEETIGRFAIPAPVTYDERRAARSLGKGINPANKDPRGWDESFKLDPDSPLVDTLFAFSRALWRGDAVTVDLPAPTTDDERKGSRTSRTTSTPTTTSSSTRRGSVPSWPT
jgi:hypothetical protein